VGTEPLQTGDLATLRARVATLEGERRRSFDEAQREADALFAQYQLSQLIASGGALADLAAAVLLELVRLADAAGGALWVGRPDGPGLALVAQSGEEPARLAPRTLANLEAARAWAGSTPGGRAVTLSEEPPQTTVAFWPRPGGTLDEDGLRIALLARHELTVAFHGARLREALDHERQELGAIVDGATDLILQVDAAGRVIRLNPAGERLLGVTSAEAVGRTCADVLGCDVTGGHGLADCPLAQVRTGAASIAYRETAIRGAIRGAIGGPVWVAGSYAAAPGTDQDARATAILRDISAQRALEELREGFVATVSHELRTPLALIRGYTETLLHLDLDADQQRAFVQRIDEASSRLAAIVDQVLDVTHLQADPLILDTNATTFDSLVARLRGDLAISGGNERLVTDVPVDLPPLQVDIARVGQILSNLVGNALKYAPDGSPVVIGASIQDECLAVTVDDEGVGIPESDRALVTEPFHRAWNVRESRIPGTGLGLFICRRLVEAHGGTLEVLDRPDGRAGTRIRFTLPIRDAAHG